MARVGVRWDWDYPFIFWYFLIRIVSQALFGNGEELTWLNTTVNGDREFINLSTRKFLEGEIVRIKVVEVSLGWANGDDPLTNVLKAFWKPARPTIINDINWSECFYFFLLSSFQFFGASICLCDGNCPQEFEIRPRLYCSPPITPLIPKQSALQEDTNMDLDSSNRLTRPSFLCKT